MLGSINHEAEHRKLWNWLAEHPDQCKTDYFYDHPEKPHPRNRCYACDVAAEKVRSRVDSICSYCPLGGEYVLGCSYDVGLYADWTNAGYDDNYALRAKLARQIAELPWCEVEVEGEEEEVDE